MARQVSTTFAAILWPTLQVRPDLQVGGCVPGGGKPPHGSPTPDRGMRVHTPGASAIRGFVCSVRRTSVGLFFAWQVSMVPHIWVAEP
jgi:hypothetical protein